MYKINERSIERQKGQVTLVYQVVRNSLALVLGQQTTLNIEPCLQLLLHNHVRQNKRTKNVICKEQTQKCNIGVSLSYDKSPLSKHTWTSLRCMNVYFIILNLSSSITKKVRQLPFVQMSCCDFVVQHRQKSTASLTILSGRYLHMVSVQRPYCCL